MSNIEIELSNDTSKISQPVNFYSYNGFSQNTEVPIYDFNGGMLCHILSDELGYIKWEDNKYFITANYSPSQAFNWLGRVAEAVVVYLCNSDQNRNHFYINHIRERKTYRPISSRFFAIGTGLLSTKNKYPFRYNPADPQGDVIWIDQTNRILLQNSINKISGIIAGLQVKVSADPKRYVLRDLMNNRYEVPLLCFDYNPYAKYYDIENYLYKNGYKHVLDGGRYINAYYFDRDAWEEVNYYRQILIELLSNKISINDVFRIEGYNHKLFNSLLQTSLLDNPGAKLQL